MKKSLSWLCPPAVALALIVAAALPAQAAPEPTGPGGVTDSALMTVIASVGDDVFSTTDLSTLIDPTMTSTQHYGPYASGSTDSGTCGPDWATDTFNREFTVHQSPDGTLTIVEQFKDGNFVTFGGTSPGACDTNPGGTVNPGVTGSLHGYFVISPFPPGTVVVQTSTSPYCDAVAMTNSGCTTGTFIDSHFSCSYGASCTVGTFFFHYAAGDQSLLFHSWKNASADRGGNSGDIANT